MYKVSKNENFGDFWPLKKKYDPHWINNDHLHK